MSDVFLCETYVQWSISVQSVLKVVCVCVRCVHCVLFLYVEWYVFV